MSTKNTLKPAEIAELVREDGRACGHLHTTPNLKTFICTLEPATHDAWHIAHDSSGKAVFSWKAAFHG